MCWRVQFHMRSQVYKHETFVNSCIFVILFISSLIICLLISWTPKLLTNLKPKKNLNYLPIRSIEILCEKCFPGIYQSCRWELCATERKHYLANQKGSPNFILRCNTLVQSQPFCIDFLTLFLDSSAMNYEVKTFIFL